jgi:hypothetical protein
MMLLGADAFFTVINVFAPSAVGEAIFVTYGPANRASLTKVCHNVARNFAPAFHYVPFFTNPFQIVLAHHC